MACLEEGSDFSQPFRDMDASGEAISLPICRDPFFSAILLVALVTSSASSVAQRVPPATTNPLHPLQKNRALRQGGGGLTHRVHCTRSISSALYLFTW